MSDAVDRQPHADYERTSRVEKAEKIRRLIERRRTFDGADVLEIGCGSGWMTTEWARMVGPDGSVQAVDRYDQRRTTEGFDFQEVAGATLPFEDDRFDIVITNHVMEHVGERPDQRHHLEEVRRVLRPDGVAYVAVPNRWRVVEPHFGLPLLSWFPPKVSSAYVRLVRKGDWYDVVPPSHRDMHRLLDAAGFEWEDVTMDSMAIMAEVETVPAVQRAAMKAPRPLLKAGFWFIPSMMYLARHPTS